MDKGNQLTEKRQGGSRTASGVRAHIALGSNVGDRRGNIRSAIEKMQSVSGVRVTKASPVYETEPVGGGPPQGMYLNAVVEVECGLSAAELLKQLQCIENELGRTRPGKDFPRTIDLDILLFGDEAIDEPDLKVPHPRMHERAFVLNPLAEIAPDAVHPVLGKTVAELRETLSRAKSGKSP
jgi:2-amino-4-hydroxy-6-hydroxymethyldihydropteridine diphosphokinase